MGLPVLMLWQPSSLVGRMFIASLKVVPLWQPIARHTHKQSTQFQIELFGMRCQWVPKMNVREKLRLSLIHQSPFVHLDNQEKGKYAEKMVVGRNGLCIVVDAIKLGIFEHVQLPYGNINNTQVWQYLYFWDFRLLLVTGFVRNSSVFIGFLTYTASESA